MPHFREQEFFGGAIKGIVPQGWIDSSTLREVPDHQELFLSPKTLSTLIIEINQRVSEEESQSTLSTLNHQFSGPDSTDKAAVIYHLHDLCDEGDTMQILTPPQRVDVPKIPGSAPSGAASVKAYRSAVSFTTPKKEDPSVFATVQCHSLLVRLEAQETDLLVFFNVPREEFEKEGDEAGWNGEVSAAEGTVGALIEKLEICDWGLFV
ncbi:hypothetical protein PENANT_c001G02554 [Penicillium antarcticum]|uniref:Uncharacterized protein n=1 Tax=Penicillium antarcticum TaxID=416450 RepID=A0A1V6QNW8_9EURO|nr:uncharacterized protein N7508_010691 [Penicillium antarcticum]KAJ5295870.1 hypothetical protein N7508_010691 [Penicillium antarcticum]OQD90636.1 hypothetical protein PENANT_c001G02554 [Penicillium antarcticum]